MAKIVGKDMGVVKRCTCRNCAAMVEYTPSETREVKYYDYTGSCDIEQVLTCPGCGTDIIT